MIILGRLLLATRRISEAPYAILIHRRRADRHPGGYYVTPSTDDIPEEYRSKIIQNSIFEWQELINKKK